MKKIVNFSIIILVALALSACGRQGEPLTPHESKKEQAEEVNQEPPKRIIKRGFILDPLLRGLETPKN